MYTIRYYSQQFHPDHFRCGGALGKTIRVLNWFRWKLETAIQRLVLRFFLKSGELPAKDAVSIRKLFELDVRKEILEKEQTSPLFPSTIEDEAMRQLAARSDRYAEGRAPSALESVRKEEGGLPVRPSSFLDLASRYGSPPRQRRYARGHKHNVGDPDGDFIPLKPGENELT